MSESDIFTLFVLLFTSAALIGTTVGMLEIVFGEKEKVE